MSFFRNLTKEIKLIIGRNLTNIPGWRTTRKIVVIESDDWGSIRMPSLEIYELMLKAGVRVDKCPYNKYDSLASESDLEKLFNVLIKFKDINNNHPVITANTVVANPDFNKIRESGYMNYYYEPFTETLKRYPEHKNSFEIWKNGMKAGVFHPQFHGREHVNVNLWLKLLQSKNIEFIKAFEYGFWGLGPDITSATSGFNIQASFDAFKNDELEFHKMAIVEGLYLFKSLFGYKSKSFIANNFIWDSSLNEVLAENEVSILQGMKYQLLPKYENDKRLKKIHFIGDRNEYEQYYIIRNCFFEPTHNPSLDNIKYCLADVSNAFFWKKPAIISMHRLNFIGHINKINRDRNLNIFETMLSAMLKKWPDIEFMTSDQLGDEIIRD